MFKALDILGPIVVLALIEAVIVAAAWRLAKNDLDKRLSWKSFRRSLVLANIAGFVGIAAGLYMLKWIFQQLPPP